MSPGSILHHLEVFLKKGDILFFWLKDNPSPRFCVEKTRNPCPGTWTHLVFANLLQASLTA